MVALNLFVYYLQAKFYFQRISYLVSCFNRYTPSPQLQLSGPADFGVTVADGKVLSQEIFVINEGSLTGEFKIRYNGDQPITIMPSGGIVKPGGRQTVKVSYVETKYICRV